MLKRLVIMSVVLLVLFGGLFGWKTFVGKKMAAMMSAPPPPAVIAATRVQSDTWRRTLTSVGTLVPYQGVNVSNEVAGIVRSLRFDSGQHVAAGDLLVQLDDTADRADLAALVAAKRLAELNFARDQKLIKEKSVSQSDFDTARATLDGAAAQVDAKEANIAKKSIRAPFAGELGIRNVDVGQYLAPGSNIVTLQALSPIFVDYNLPERYLSELSAGQAVEIGVQAYPDRVFKGTISAVSPRIDVPTRSVQVRAVFDNADQSLKPGMFAQVHTILPTQSDVLTLPERSIAYNPYGNAVFVIEDKDGKQSVTSRPVKTGDVRDGRIEILEGLAVGDQVVSDGLNKLRNGQAVRIDNSVQLDAAPVKP